MPHLRPTDLRLARAHLRLGRYALARAELETKAALGELDREALADLAEARWRTGDLPGAGQAAQAHLEAGGDDTTGLVIAAEAAMADGRVADARQLAESARQGADDLESIFAGQRRSRVWRLASPGETAAEAVSRPLSATTGEERPPATDRASTNARELIAFAAAVLRDDPGRAAVELAIVLRLEPSLAPAVLEVLTRAAAGRASRSAAALEVVRGDAYRLIGRPRQAEQAYARAGALLGEMEGAPT